MGDLAGLGAHMEEGDIRRQRRNLVAMSCLLIIFDLAKVKVEKVGVLGTDLIVGDVEVLRISMWVVWAYFLWRYYQFWRQDKPHVSRAVSELLDSYARNFFHQKSAYADTITDRPALLRPGWICGWKVEGPSYEPSRGLAVSVDSVSVSALRALFWRLRAFGAITVHTPHVTEHVLPLALAAVTLMVNFLPKMRALL